MNRTVWLALVAALLIGVGLRFVIALEPVWWLAWFLPGLLLALSLRLGVAASRWCVALAAGIGVTVNLPLFLSIMPVQFVALVMLLQVLLWMFVIGMSRRLMLATAGWWSVLALPVIGVAADTLLAHFTPDGNWGSLGYTQADVLPVAQLASLFGVGGVLFVLLLVNGAVALAIHRSAAIQSAWPAFALTAAVLLGTLGYGYARLQAPVTGRPMNFGIAAIDDFLEGATDPRAESVWAQYRTQIASLAAAGARIVLLPEKISVVPAAEAQRLEHMLGAVARQQGVWLVAGLGVDTGAERRNEAWWFAPDGRRVTNYLKHFMAPPEREFVAGKEFPVNEIEGATYGVAICKDMHFASLGRAFGERQAAVMLVPAWDFYRDAWMAANMTNLRGVENGFSVVRSSREGLLSVADPYGRLLAATRSANLPGRSLVVTATVGARVPTLYTRIGDTLGWFCVAAMVGWLWWGRRSGRIGDRFIWDRSS